MIKARSTPSSTMLLYGLSILAISGAICLVLAIEQLAIASVNGWWADELFALWASDRNVGFAGLFFDRIVSDSNPPLYFSLLHAARLVISDDRTAVVGLNFAILVIGAGAVVGLAFRSRYRNWIYLSFALFVSSGPVAAYLPEARSYCLAMTASYIGVLLASLAVIDAAHRPNWIPFLVAGLVAGLSHIFAAILCCALAAAIFGADFLSGKFRPRAPAVALAASAVGFSVIWMLMWLRWGPGTLAQVSWLPFTAAFVWESGRDAFRLTYGFDWLAVMFGFAIGLGLVDQRSRRLAFVIAISALLFIVVPILISYRVPIILTRYWLVGSPLFLAPLAFLIGSWRAGPAPATFPIAVAVILIVVSLPLSFRAAADFVAAKPIWRGIPIVNAELGGCGPDAIHVLGFTPGFALVTGAPPNTFVDVRTLNASTRSASGTCPILGWSEHYVLRFGPNYMAQATSEELLQLLKLAYAPNEVTIDRHPGGFVIRQKL